MEETTLKSGADFENDHLLYKKAQQSNEYFTLLIRVNHAKKIFILGNGGLMDVSSHGAADLSRLIPKKAFYSFNNAGFLTSNANDFGFNNAFIKWLQTTVEDIEDPNTTLILGLSCSGNSENVIQALEWAHNLGFMTFLISGVKSTRLPKDIAELTFGVKYFHTNEVLTMKIFYDIVYKLGHHCPDIAGEIERKKKV